MPNEALSIEEWISLAIDFQKVHKKIKRLSTEIGDELALEVLVGPCPRCGCEKTIDCEGIPGVDDQTVGLCEECGFLWCTECSAVLGESPDCGHWEICASCRLPKDEDGDCGFHNYECDIIDNWILSKGQAGSGKRQDN